MHDKTRDVASLLIHADRELNETHAVTPPIWQTANFFSTDLKAFREVAEGVHPREFYTRYGNPNASQFESIVAQLEGTEAALATASGMGAMTLAVMSHVRPGDHVVGQKSHYASTGTLLDEVLPSFGIKTTRVDQTKPQAFADAVTPATKLFILETPSNPILQLTDLKAVSEIAKKHGILTVIDSTFASPINTRPAEFGIDIVMHSATKYLGGHSDVIAGVLAASKEIVDRLWHFGIVFGASLGPFDAWLLVRGLRTLQLRVAQQNRNAAALAEFLSKHKKVANVNYPGLPSHPQHELAKRQMDGFGGIVSFEVRGGYDAAAAVAGRLRVPRYAASLGAVESLIVQPAAMWSHVMNEDGLKAAAIPAGLLRLSVGIESEKDLIRDLDQALAN